MNMVDRKQFENQTYYTFATADPISLTAYSLQELEDLPNG